MLDCDKTTASVMSLVGALTMDSGDIIKTTYEGQLVDDEAN